MRFFWLANVAELITCGFSRVVATVSAISWKHSARKVSRSDIMAGAKPGSPGRLLLDWGDNNMLVISRSVLKLRDFKIIVGLVDMSCTTANIPLVEGARKRHAASIAASTPKSV